MLNNEVNFITNKIQACNEILEKKSYKINALLFSTRVALMGLIISDQKFSGNDIIINTSLIEKASKNACYEGCQLTYSYLFHNYRNIFPDGYNLYSYNGAENSLNKFKRIQWSYHFYTCVKDIENNYYALSPANIGILDPNPFNTIIFSDSIISVKKMISNIEGGQWSHSKIWGKGVKRIEPFVKSTVIKKYTDQAFNNLESLNNSINSYG